MRLSVLHTQYAGKGRPFNVNTDSSDQKWTLPKFGLRISSRQPCRCSGNVAQSFMPQSSIASHYRHLPV